MDVVLILSLANLLVKGMTIVLTYTHHEPVLINLYSNVLHEQIDYAILTRDIYGLCGISSGGFCAEV